MRTMATCARVDIYAHNHALRPPKLPVKTRNQSVRAISYAWLGFLNILHLQALVMYGISRLGNKAGD